MASAVTDGTLTIGALSGSGVLTATTLFGGAASQTLSIGSLGLYT